MISPDQQLLSAMRHCPPPDYSESGTPIFNGAAEPASLWLGTSGACSPVVAQLAADPEPTARLLSLQAIRGAPNAENRQLLHKLLTDPDSHVRANAQALDAELNTLATRPLSELTSAGKIDP